MLHNHNIHFKPAYYVYWIWCLPSVYSTYLLWSTDAAGCLANAGDMVVSIWSSMCGMQYNRTASGIVTEATVLSYVKRLLRIATICFVFAWWIHVLTNGPSKITSALLIANHDVTGSPKYTSYHNQRGTIPYSFLRGSTYMYNTLKYVYCFVDTFAGHQNHPDFHSVGILHLW